jgi:hypothetical protein
VKIQAVKNIYLQFGWNFTSEYEGILKTHLEDDQEKRAEVKRKNAKNGTILHTYTPQEFGITEKELSSGGYADYIQKYKIPMSKN